MTEASVTLTKSAQSMLRSTVMTAVIVVVLFYFLLSDYQATGEITGFGWIGIAAVIAGFVAIGQQIFYFQREPASLQLDLLRGQVVSGDTGKTLASFDTVTFFALSTNKNNALIECTDKGEMVMRLKRHYELPLKISDILAKYSDLEAVELKFVGLAK